jgi:hypothetical protein
MNVAWQRRYDLVRCGIRSSSCGRELNVEPPSYRTLAGRNALSNWVEAENRQATFIESLRDKVLCDRSVRCFHRSVRPQLPQVWCTHGGRRECVWLRLLLDRAVPVRQSIRKEIPSGGYPACRGDG